MITENEINYFTSRIKPVNKKGVDFKRVMGRALAARVDTYLWWLALEDENKQYIYQAFIKTVDDLKPVWIPKKIWRWLHKR